MSLLGRLLRNRRAGETHMAWNMPNLQGPEPLILTSRDFGDGEPMALEQCAKTIGGADLSPTWPGRRPRAAPPDSCWWSRTSTCRWPDPPCTASP